LRDALGCLLFGVLIFVAVLFGLRELFWEIATELIGWSLLAAIVLPGSLVAAAIDHFIALDRAQLWTLSILFTVLTFVALGALLNRVRSTDEIVLWYPALVGSLLIAFAILFFGFKIRWIGSFMARFAFGPELFDVDRWMPVVIQLVIASGMMLTGVAVIAFGWATTVTFSRIQIWLLALVSNIMAGAAIGGGGGARDGSCSRRATAHSIALMSHVGDTQRARDQYAGDAAWMFSVFRVSHRSPGERLLTNGSPMAGVAEMNSRASRNKRCADSGRCQTGIQIRGGADSPHDVERIIKGAAQSRLGLRDDVPSPRGFDFHPPRV